MTTQTNTTKECILLISEFEKIIGELYEIYEKKFSNQSEFWRHLIDDEKKHSKTTLEFINNESNICLNISPCRFNKYQIEDAIDDIKNIIVDSQHNLTFEEALFTAYKFENATESIKFLESSPSDPEELKQLLNYLQKECNRHATLIKRQLANFGKQI